MELALAMLMVLGIFVGIPALIGFAIVGTYILRDRRARRTELKETLLEELAQRQREAQLKYETAQPVGRTPVGAHQKR